MARPLASESHFLLLKVQKCNLASLCPRLSNDSSKKPFGVLSILKRQHQSDTRCFAGCCFFCVFFNYQTSQSPKLSTHQIRYDLGYSAVFKRGQPATVLLRNLFPWPLPQRFWFRQGPRNLYCSKVSSDSIALARILSYHLMFCEGPAFSTWQIPIEGLR